METILIFVETKGDEAKKASLELLSEGRKLAKSGRFKVEAAVLGPLSGKLEEKLLALTETLVHIDDPLLESYTPEAYAAAFAGYAKEANPKIILAGATQTGRDFLPRVAVLLGCGIVSDVTAAAWDDRADDLRAAHLRRQGAHGSLTCRLSRYRDYQAEHVPGRRRPPAARAAS